MAKTIRFGDLVRNSGRPARATLWADPKNDHSFSKAVRENRVLTISPGPSHKKEYGQIGFWRSKGAGYLVFPEPLPRDNSRVIGINYQLLDEGIDAKLRPSEHQTKVVKKGKALRPVPPRPELRTFDVTVRRTATLEETRQIKAVDTKEAEEAVAEVESERFDIDRASLQTKVLSVKQRD